MSDVGIDTPAWLAPLALSVEFWPAIFALTTAALCVAVFLSGIWRRVAIALAILLVLDLTATGLIGLTRVRDETNAQIYDQSVNTTLTAERSIDGLKLPAGTSVTWADPTHTHINDAVLPKPAAVFGVMMDRVQRSVDGGWAVHLAGPQSVDGWTCQPDLVELAQEGHLRRCALAVGRDWNGWPIPATTLVTLTELTVGFVFPLEHPVMAREIGRVLPATGGMTMNTDGSLDAIYFDAEAPLIVCGASLWNTVQWRYDPSTFGQGRDRKPVALSGASPADEPVDLVLADCKPPLSSGK